MSLTPLQSPDLLLQILSFLFPNKQDLFAASLVCQDFRWQSQTILWREIESLLPIFKTLSQLQYNEEDNYWYLGGIITEGDVERLILFGKRVRSIRFTARDRPCNIDPSVYILVARALKGESLLPNLTQLRVLKGTTPNNFKPLTLPLLYAPCLRLVSFGEPLEDKEVSLFMYHLSGSPYVDTFWNTHVCNHQTLETMPTFRNLSRFSLQADDLMTIPFSFLRSLSTLQNLHDMTLKTRFFSPRSGISLDQVRFDALKFLSLTCPSEDALTILSSIKFPSLRYLSHSIVVPPSEPYIDTIWPRIFEAVVECTSTNFQEFVFGTTSLYRGANTRDVQRAINTYQGLPFSQVEEFLYQLKLRDLFVLFPRFDNISIEGLTNMAQHWPGMRRLKLNLQNPTPLSALELISSKFLFLTDLMLDINAETIPDLSSTSPCHPLTNITIRLYNWKPLPRNITSLATLIDMLFPKLKTIDLKTISQSISGNTIITRTEADVTFAIQALQSARQRERISQK